MALPNGAVGWSAVCDCAIFLVVLNCFFYLLVAFLNKYFSVVILNLNKEKSKNGGVIVC